MNSVEEIEELNLIYDSHHSVRTTQATAKWTSSKRIPISNSSTLVSPMVTSLTYIQQDFFRFEAHNFFCTIGFHWVESTLNEVDQFGHYVRVHNHSVVFIYYLLRNIQNLPCHETTGKIVAVLFFRF